jgi:hypothetical protein
VAEVCFNPQMSRDRHFEDVVGGGESSPSAGADGGQGSQSECEAKCDAILADCVKLLTRSVTLVAGMKMAEAERAAVLAWVIADLTSSTTQIPK